MAVIAYSDWRERLRQAEQPGMRYLWAHDPNPSGPYSPGSDCSGLAHWQYGIWLDWVYPQTAVLWNNANHLGRLRPVSEVQPGWMLMHRANYMGQPIGHVGMYVGDEGNGPETVEAHSSHTIPQVGRFPAFVGRKWETCIAVPEIGVDLNTVSTFVAACRATTIALGATGPVVSFLQQELGIKVDGVYGPVTQGTVWAFQEWFQGAQQHATPPVTDPRFLLPITGICDPHTWASLALKDG